MKAGQRKQKMPGGGGPHKRRQGGKPHLTKRSKPEKGTETGLKRKQPEAMAAPLGAFSLLGCLLQPL